MSDDELQDVINSVGVMAEVLGLFRDALIRNGFDRDDVIYLCGVYVEVLAK